MPYMISVASYKGGVGKTTTAIHLAYFFQMRGKTILLDADANRASVAWAEAGSLPFTVVPYKQGLKQVPQFEYVIVDTEAGASGSRRTPRCRRGPPGGGIEQQNAPDRMALWWRKQD
jgi:hypothetical protein